MVATTDIQASGASVTTVTGGETGDMLLSNSYVVTVANFPTEQVYVSDAYVTTLMTYQQGVRLSNSYITVVATGRIDDPKVRAWTYTMDGHDFYVLRLGTRETLVYDTQSGQWYTWGTLTSRLWRPFDGINWPGAERWAQTYGSTVIVGDDGNGSLYFLDPTKYVDDTPLSVEGAEDQEQFERTLTGQVTKRGYDREKCYSVELLGSIGESTNSSLTNVTLYTSDDQGHTYDNQGTVSVDNADYDARIDWRSLGSFPAPGRLFKLVDYGSLARIDSISMESDRE